MLRHRGCGPRWGKDDWEQRSTTTAVSDRTMAIALLWAAASARNCSGCGTGRHARRRRRRRTWPSPKASRREDQGHPKPSTVGQRWTPSSNRRRRCDVCANLPIPAICTKSVRSFSVPISRLSRCDAREQAPDVVSPKHFFMHTRRLPRRLGERSTARAGTFGPGERGAGGRQKGESGTKVDGSLKISEILRWRLAC